MGLWQWLFGGVPQPPANKGKGKVVRKLISCGREGCHCEKGGSERHGPYLYLQWREGGTVRSRYMGKANVE